MPVPRCSGYITKSYMNYSKFAKINMSRPEPNKITNILLPFLNEFLQRNISYFCLKFRKCLFPTF